MLIETTFRIGGTLCLLVAVLLLVGYLWAGLALDSPQLYLAPGLFAFLGGLFLYVGRDAERSRRELLATGDRGAGDAAPAHGPRR